MWIFAILALMMLGGKSEETTLGAGYQVDASGRIHPVGKAIPVAGTGGLVTDHVAYPKINTAISSTPNSRGTASDGAPPPVVNENSGSSTFNDVMEGVETAAGAVKAVKEGVETGIEVVSTIKSWF